MIRMRSMLVVWMVFERWFVIVCLSDCVIGRICCVDCVRVIVLVRLSVMVS